MLELEQPQFICHVETTVVTSVTLQPSFAFKFMSNVLLSQLAEAERLKKLGNECFKNGSYVEAEVRDGEFGQE